MLTEQFQRSKVQSLRHLTIYFRSIMCRHIRITVVTTGHHMADDLGSGRAAPVGLR